MFSHLLKLLYPSYVVISAVYIIVNNIVLPNDLLFVFPVFLGTLFKHDTQLPKPVSLLHIKVLINPYILHIKEKHKHVVKNKHTTDPNFHWAHMILEPRHEKNLSSGFPTRSDKLGCTTTEDG